MKQFLAFEGVQEARKFTFDCIDERLNNLNFSEGAFNKQFESLCEQVVALQEAIKAIKDTQNEQSREITTLQKRIWAMELSKADIKKQEQKQKLSNISLKNYIKGELKTELLEFIKGELATKTDGLKTTLAEYESGLKTPEVAEAQKADKTPKIVKKDEDVEQRKRHAKNAARWRQRHPGYKTKRRAYRRKPATKYALELYNLNKERLLFGGITLHYFKRLWEIRKTQKHLYKRTAGADIKWLLDLANRYGKHAISFLKAALDFHAQTGKQPPRSLKIIDFSKVGLFAEKKGVQND